MVLQPYHVAHPQPLHATKPADIRPSDRHTIDFSTISPLWLRQAAKHYIRYSFATLAWSTCVAKKKALGYFSSFLAEYRPRCLASDINRLLIVEFLSYLVSKKLTEKVRLECIVYLGIFFTLCSRYDWADIGDKTLIYKEDHPRLKKSMPRYIPQEVLLQLNQDIDTLPESVMRMVLVIQESGMRVSELCRLRFDCLRQDLAGDWWLYYYQFKMKKDHTVNISRELAAVIQEQQSYIRNNLDSSFQYLFCANTQGRMQFTPKNKPMGPKSFGNECIPVL